LLRNQNDLINEILCPQKLQHIKSESKYSVIIYIMSRKKNVDIKCNVHDMFLKNRYLADELYEYAEKFNSLLKEKAMVLTS
jgi:hypothetical protein